MNYALRHRAVTTTVPLVPPSLHSLLPDSHVAANTHVCFCLLCHLSLEPWLFLGVWPGEKTASSPCCPFVLLLPNLFRPKQPVLSRLVWLCDPMDCSRQTSLSMIFSRQEYWRGLPFPSPGGLPDPGIKPGSPALQADSLPLSHLGSPSGSA